MRTKKVVALARAVLFRRYRTMLIRPQGTELIATLLNFDYEVRSAQDAFKDVPPVKLTGEMLDLAGHIIGTKRGEFDPATYDDRYEAALTELVKAKIEGKSLPQKPAPPEEKIVSLLDALKESAHLGAASKAKSQTKAQSRRKKAG
jgi:DNA end-binding protein Ku